MEKLIEVSLYQSRRFVSAILALLFILLPLTVLPTYTSAATGVPTIISYQGRLTDSNGNTLGGASGTTYYFKFAIYDNATVGSGSKLWPAGAPSEATTTVTSGRFSFNVGDTANGFPDALTYNFQDNRDVFLQVQVATSSGGSYETLSPRQRITSSGFAINAGTLLGYTPSQLPTGSNIPVLNSGNLTLGGTNPQLNATSTNTLTLQGGTGTGDIQFFSSSNRITSGGNLTIAGTLSAATTTLTGLTISANGLTLASSTPFSATNTLYNLGGTLYFNGTRAGAVSSSTSAGLVQFSDGASGFNANALFAWDNANNRLGLGTSALPSSTLHVVGTATVTGQATLAAASSTNFSASGFATIGGALSVTGVTSLAGITFTNATGTGNLQIATFNSTGNGTVAGQLAVTSGISAATSTVTGTSTLAGATATFFNNSGNQMIGGALSVTGASALSTLTFTNATGTNNLSLSGLLSAASSTVAGTSTLAGISGTYIVSSGALQGATLNTSGNATIGGQALLTSGISAATSTVTGTSTLAGVAATFLNNSGATMLGSTLNVASLSTLAAVSSTALTASGDVNFGGILNVTGKSTLANVSSTALTASGAVNLGNILNVTGTSTLAGASVSFLSSSGAVMLGSTLNVTGKSTLANVSSTALTASGDINAGAALNVTATTTLSSGLIIPVGSAGNPTFTFASDNNTGIWSPGADTIALSTAGSERLRVHSDGKIGIGTTATPSSTLHIVGTFQVTATSTFQGPTIIDDLNLGELTFAADSGIVALVDMPVTSNAATSTIQSYRVNIDGNTIATFYAESDGSGGVQNTSFQVGTSTAATGLFTVATSTTIFNVTQAGRVGVGTGATPSSTLHVVGNFQVTATSTLANASATNFTASGFVNTASLTASGLTTLASTTFSSATGTTLLVTNASSTNFTASGFINAGSLQVSGTSTLAGASVSFLSSSGAVMLGSTLNVTGASTFATTTAFGLTLSTNGLTISSSTPFTTTNTLYNLGGALKWNGSNVVSSASGTAGYLQLSDGSSGLTANSLLKWDGTNNRLGIGTAVTPSSTLHVVGTFQVTATSTLQGPTIIDDLIVGASNFEADAGQVSWVDMAVSASSTTSTVHSYTAQLDGNPMITVYGEANGSGGLQNPRIGFGTSTPTYQYDFVGTSTTMISFRSDGSIVVGAPTGGAKGFGTINAVAVYDDNTLLTDYVFDLEYDGKIKEEDQELFGTYQMLTIDELAEFLKSERHLPGIAGRDEWAEKGKPSVGQLLNGVWRNTEEFSIYITELNSRVKELEKIAGISGLQGGSASGALTADTNIEVRDAVFNGSITVKGPVFFNKDTVGFAKIKSGSQTVRVNFTETYPRKPVVTASVIDSLLDFRYAIKNLDTTGFNIDLDRTIGEDLTLGWHAFPAPVDGVIFVSDGTTESITITVITPPASQPPATNSDQQTGGESGIEENQPSVTEPETQEPAPSSPEVSQSEPEEEPAPESEVAPESSVGTGEAGS